MNSQKNFSNGQRQGEAQRSTLGATWTSREAYLLASVCLLFGLVLGYLFRGSAGLTAVSPASGGAAVPSGAPAGMPGTMLPNAAQTAAGSAPLTVEALNPLAAPLLAAVKADPKNFDALAQLGNLYFDHKLYNEAISYYTKALELKPNDVNVRTDLGTAWWYTGDAKKAVAEYEKSLKVDPGHSNTLMNLGVVRLNGLQDPKGAIAAWEQLLKLHPDTPDKQRVLDHIAEAKAGLK